MSRACVPSLAALLESFFSKRLLHQRGASPHTVASYRDTFRLLLRFAEAELRRAPSDLTVDDLDAPFISDFLKHLETERGNSSRTKNLRLAAIHSFYRYVALEDPTHGAVAQRVLALPTRRAPRRQIDFLDDQEQAALLAAPDNATWAGRRDRALLLLALQTGLRVSELIGLKVQDIELGHGAHVRCRGKGRKNRATPLRRDVAKVLRGWLRELGDGRTTPLLPNARGGPLSRDGVGYLLAKHVVTAMRTCPSLRKKRVTPHVLRHSAAMALLQGGVDRSVIALWLGHESVKTTEVYLHADFALKERALARTRPHDVREARYRPTDRLLAFLESL